MARCVAGGEGVGGCDMCKRTRQEKIAPFIFVSQKIKVRKN